MRGERAGHHAVAHLDTAAGQTNGLLRFVRELSWGSLDEAVRHAARRHLLDTVGVMVAGCSGELVGRLASVLPTVSPNGPVPVPSGNLRADVLDAAQIGGTGAHGIEQDDGYRQGSVHPGVAVIPAALALAHDRQINGTDLLVAVVAGYESIISIARAAHPELRRRGFHPTGAVGVFGATAASARLLRLDDAMLANAFGLAASRSAGLFAFLRGGADVKRLHAGYAARDGILSAQLAQAGMLGPPDVLEGDDGFLQAFAFGTSPGPRLIALPPDTEFGITDCYIKPYPCCRHLQPAVEALMALCREHRLAEDDVRSIKVETYGIAAEHAHTGWSDFASAQLSFPFIMAIGLRYGEIALEHFDDQVRSDPGIARICAMVSVSTAPDLDRLYPEFRPARVTVETANGRLEKSVSEALGSKLVPLDDAGLDRKFLKMCEPAIGIHGSAELLDLLWNLDTCRDVSQVLDRCAKQPGSAA